MRRNGKRMDFACQKLLNNDNREMWHLKGVLCRR